MYLVANDSKKKKFKSFAEFIKELMDVEDIVDLQYDKLMINGEPWKQFHRKVLFINKIMQVEEELRRILGDINVRDIFLGREAGDYKDKSSTDISPYNSNNQKLYVVMNEINDQSNEIDKKLSGEFPIEYIKWGSFTETVPGNPPLETFPSNIKNKFDEILDTDLGLDFRSKYCNLTAIGLDWKITRGQYIHKPSIVFYVIRKGVIPICDNLLPQKIGSIDTDVREGFNEQTDMYSQDFREYMDPISTGCSIGIAGTETWTGTLGAFVRDSNKHICLLTNNYIEEPEELEVNNEVRKMIVANTHFASFTNGIRDNKCQINEKNYGVNAAIAALELNEKDEPQLPIMPRNFAVKKSGFDTQLSGVKNFNLADTEPIFKVGCATGLTEGHIQEAFISFCSGSGSFMLEHQLEAILPDADLDIKGRSIFRSVWLDRQIIVRSKEGNFMERGDSGCIWFDKDGKIIALGHGTLNTNSGGFAIGSPINAVLKALEVEIYLGNHT